MGGNSKLCFDCVQNFCWDAMLCSMFSMSVYCFSSFMKPVLNCIMGNIEQELYRILKCAFLVLLSEKQIYCIFMHIVCVLLGFYRHRARAHYSHMCIAHRIFFYYGRGLWVQHKAFVWPAAFHWTTVDQGIYTENETKMGKEVLNYYFKLLF